MFTIILIPKSHEQQKHYCDLNFIEKSPGLLFQFSMESNNFFMVFLYTLSFGWFFAPFSLQSSSPNAFPWYYHPLTSVSGVPVPSTLLLYDPSPKKNFLKSSDRMFPFAFHSANATNTNAALSWWTTICYNTRSLAFLKAISKWVGGQGMLTNTKVLVLEMSERLLAWADLWQISLWL